MIPLPDRTAHWGFGDPGRGNVAADPGAADHWGSHPALLPDHPAYHRQYCTAVPEIGGQLWWPVVETLDPCGNGYRLNATSYIRWEACDAARRILRSGRAVAIVDACPTCAPRVVWAGGPSSPLTCAWRPKRGILPRWSDASIPNAMGSAPVGVRA
jgi:hypothetical protein